MSDRIITNLNVRQVYFDMVSAKITRSNSGLV
jgi:hypothetical protein